MGCPPVVHRVRSARRVYHPPAGVQRVVERHDPGFRPVQDAAEHGDEVRVGRIVGPQAEGAAGAEQAPHPLEPGGGVEAGVAGGQDVPGRVVDVDEDGVEPASGPVGVETRLARDAGEEVAVQQPHPRVAGQPGGLGQQLVPVPVDDLRQGLHHDQRPDPWIVQYGGRRVPQAQPAGRGCRAAPAARDRRAWS